MCYMCDCIIFVVFFKQKTAYEMRISDWSSDVCSSDLRRSRRRGAKARRGGGGGEKARVRSCTKGRILDVMGDERRRCGIGDRVPGVTFRLRDGAQWVEKTSAELYGNRRVVIFAVPAAFSTSCSARHLPGYVALARNIKRMGIDEIFCVAVNDAFVMNAWARDQGIEDEVALLPDGNGDFTRAMGMLADQSGRGFGARSRRYSMVAHAGVIQQIFLENRDGSEDPIEVSDAITMLDYLDSTALRAAGE